jgi:hypothetical protein
MWNNSGGAGSGGGGWNSSDNDRRKSGSSPSSSSSASRSDPNTGGFDEGSFEEKPFKIDDEPEFKDPYSFDLDNNNNTEEKKYLSGGADDSTFMTNSSPAISKEKMKLERELEEEKRKFALLMRQRGMPEEEIQKSIKRVENIRDMLDNSPLVKTGIICTANLIYFGSLSFFLGYAKGTVIPSLPIGRGTPYQTAKQWGIVGPIFAVARGTASMTSTVRGGYDVFDSFGGGFAAGALFSKHLGKMFMIKHNRALNGVILGTIFGLVDSVIIPGRPRAS